MYQNQGTVAGAQAPQNPKSAIEAPILLGCHQRIHARINGAHENASRIEAVVDRLLNPVPRPVGPDSGKVSTAPHTIEAMLNQLEADASHLAERLFDLAQRLERAA